MGTSEVAEAAAVSAGVALAMMRSTSEDRKPLMMVEQLLLSPEAFCTSMFTSSPSSSFSASTKPWVAASKAGCWASWHTPTR